MPTPQNLKNNLKNTKTNSENFFDTDNIKIPKELLIDRSMENMYEEGELTIDVFEDNDNNIVIKSAIAGIKPEDIDISVNNDMLTIRGKRELDEKIDEKNYFYRECYWGSFSRTIILPCEVKPDKILAKFKNGILTINIPKARPSKKTVIKVVDES